MEPPFEPERGDFANPAAQLYQPSMSWAALILILVMVIAGSKLVRHSLALLAAIASIVALAWLLTAHAPAPRVSGSHASLTSRTMP